MQSFFSLIKMPHLAVLLLAGLLLAPAVQAQTGEDALRFSQRAPASGPRMMGMAGAGIAGVADYGAFFANPAGLGYFRSSSFSGSLNTLSTQDEALYQVPGTSNSLISDVNATHLGHLGYVYKVPTARGAFVVGAALNQVHSFDRDLFFEGDNPNNSITDYFMPLASEFTLEEDAEGVFPSFNRPLSFIAFETFAIDFDEGLFDDGASVPFLPAVTAGTVTQGGNVTETGRMRELNFGGAVEASEDVMVGLSLNIPFGTYNYRQVFEEEDSFNDNDGTGGTTDFEYLRFTERLESSLTGISLRGGLSAKVAPSLRFGLSVETPTYYNIQDQFSGSLETLFDNGDRFSYGEVFDEDALAGSFEYQLTTPWRLGGGVGYTSGGLTLLGDVEFIDWSQLRLEADAFGFDDVNQRIRQNLDAVINTRVGVEFQTGNLMVRGGFAYQPDPRGTAVEPADEPELDRDHTFVSAGLGYQVNNQFVIDFGWMQEQFDDQFQPYTEVLNAPVVNEQVVRNQFSVGVRMLF